LNGIKYPIDIKKSRTEHSRDPFAMC